MAKEELTPVKGARSTGLTNTISELKKKYGVSSIIDIEKDEHIPGIVRVPTESPYLDDALGGGYPVGRIIEIYGGESSGKTSLACFIAGQAQKHIFRYNDEKGKPFARDGIVAFIDAEHALDMEYAQTLGLNTNKMFMSQPDSGEQALNICIDLASSGEIDIIIIDSVSALVPQAEIDGDMENLQIGLQARMMSKAMRKLVGIASKTQTTIIFINQIRMKIGVMYGNPETTSGGNALKFYSSVRIETRSGEPFYNDKNDKTKKTGMISNIKVVKNKTSSPGKKKPMKITFGEGYQTEEQWVSLMGDYGVIKKGGAGWFTLPSGEKCQGVPNLVNILNENLDLKEELIAKTRSAFAATRSGRTPVLDTEDISSEEKEHVHADQESTD